MEKYRLNPDVTVKNFEEEQLFFAFNNKTGDHYSMNYTSFWLLKNIDEKSTDENLLADFTSEFDLNEKLAEKDLKETIDNLLNESIILKEVN